MVKRDIEELLVKSSWLLAIIGIIVCIVTWYIDLAGLVHHCPYCRVQRTMIGIVAIMLLLAPMLPRFFRIASIPFAVFGVDIAGDQLFLVFKNGNFPNMNGLMAMCALILIVLLEVALFLKTSKKYRNITK